MRAFGVSLALAGVLVLGSARDASGVSAVVWGAATGDWNDSYYHPQLHTWWDPAAAAWYVGYVQSYQNAYVQNGGTVTVGSLPSACCASLTVGGVYFQWEEVPVVGRQSTVEVYLPTGNPALSVYGPLDVGGAVGGGGFVDQKAGNVSAKKVGVATQVEAAGDTSSPAQARPSTRMRLEALTTQGSASG
jgi:hypothetical protein